MEEWNPSLHPLFDRVVSLMRDEVRPSALTRDRDASFPVELIESARAAGIYAAYVPKEFGGLGLSLPDLCCLYFEMGRHSLDLAWVTSVGSTAAVGTDLILQFAITSRRKELMDRAVASGVQFCIANSESGSGTNPALMRSAVSENTNGPRLSGGKDCATNAPIADVHFVSARRNLGEKSVIDVFLLSRSQVEVSPLQSELMGYRTGSAGSLRFDINNFNIDAHLLGKAGAGFRQFRRCFDMERLMLSALVAGVLQGLEDEALEVIRAKERYQRSFSERQYIQQKLLIIFGAKEKIWALVQRALSTDLAKAGQTLGLMKWVVIREGLDAALAFLELVGQDALMRHHLAQKIVRDMVALRFFGGSMELQKIAIFNDFPRAIGGPGVTGLRKAG